MGVRNTPARPASPPPTRHLDAPGGIFAAWPTPRNQTPAGPLLEILLVRQSLLEVLAVASATCGRRRRAGRGLQTELVAQPSVEPPSAPVDAGAGPRELERDLRGLALPPGRFHGRHDLDLELGALRPALVRPETALGVRGDADEERRAVPQGGVMQRVDVGRMRRRGLVHSSPSRTLPHIYGICHKLVHWELDSVGGNRGSPEDLLVNVRPPGLTIRLMLSNSPRAGCQPALFDAPDLAFVEPVERGEIPIGRAHRCGRPERLVALRVLHPPLGMAEAGPVSLDRRERRRGAVPLARRLSDPAGQLVDLDRR